MQQNKAFCYVEWRRETILCQQGALSIMVGRKRKYGAVRTKSGQISRAGQGGIHPETLSVRERQLKAAGLVLEFSKMESGREVKKRTAEDRLSGYSLGQLRLRKQQDESNPGGISQDQFEAGEAWACLVVARKVLDDSRRMNVKSQFENLVKGEPSPEDSVFFMARLASVYTEEERIARIRKRWKACEAALEAGCVGDPVWKVKQVLYGVCVENWPIAQLSEADLGQLRTGLNAVGKALR